jgi:hypothetical protein
VSNFFVAARRRERKKMCLYCLCYYSNRVDAENMIKVTDCNGLENLVEFYIFIWGTTPGGDDDIWAIKLYSSLTGFLNLIECFKNLQHKDYSGHNLRILVNFLDGEK